MFNDLMKNIDKLQKGAAILDRFQKLDADENGVVDMLQHQQYLAEELSLANALREKLDQHAKLIDADARALGVFDILDEKKPEAVKGTEGKAAESASKVDKKGK